MKNQHIEDLYTIIEEMDTQNLILRNQLKAQALKAEYFERLALDTELASINLAKKCSTSDNSIYHFLILPVLAAIFIIGLYIV